MLDLTGRCLTILTSTLLAGGILDDIKSATGATDVQVGDNLQELWGGYGGIIQLQLQGAADTSAILKLISPPAQPAHPRGWNTLNSHQRKLRSYQVETHWYETYARQCDEQCPVPQVFATGNDESRHWILMEDLSNRYPLRAQSLSVVEASVCLEWLAAFHARFLSRSPEGLWPIGTYWHLATREDEYNSMTPGALKQFASRIDAQLNNCEFQSIVHGDAKVANFCFSHDMTAVAAVDFQYVGGGVGIKDVVYFLGSCLDENIIERQESQLLSIYFSALQKQVSAQHSPALADGVVHAWSALYAIAWTDFYRFLEGWMPGHKKINRYTKSLAERTFNQLSG